MATDELIEVKFRLPDGNYIGHTKYSSTTTVVFLKEKIVSQWPHGNFLLSSQFYLFSHNFLVLSPIFCWDFVIYLFFNLL